MDIDKVRDECIVIYDKIRENDFDSWAEFSTGFLAAQMFYQEEAPVKQICEYLANTEGVKDGTESLLRQR